MRWLSIAIILFLVFFYFKKKANAAPVARGLRNNNPFNLKKSKAKWVGKIDGTDPVFETFDTLENGLAAGMRNIKNKVQRNGLNTITKLISKLSPISDNSTQDFINYVSSNSGIAPDAVITTLTPQLYKSIVDFECGIGAVDINTISSVSYSV